MADASTNAERRARMLETISKASANGIDLRLLAKKRVGRPSNDKLAFIQVLNEVSALGTIKKELTGNGDDDEDEDSEEAESTDEDEDAHQHDVYLPANVWNKYFSPLHDSEKEPLAPLYDERAADTKSMLFQTRFLHHNLSNAWKLPLTAFQFGVYFLPSDPDLLRGTLRHHSRNIDRYTLRAMREMVNPSDYYSSSGSTQTQTIESTKLELEELCSGHRVFVFDLDLYTYGGRLYVQEIGCMTMDGTHAFKEKIKRIGDNTSSSSSSSSSSFTHALRSLLFFCHALSNQEPPLLLYQGNKHPHTLMFHLLYSTEVDATDREDVFRDLNHIQPRFASIDAFWSGIKHVLCVDAIPMNLKRVDQALFFPSGSNKNKDNQASIAHAISQEARRCLRDNNDGEPPPPSSIQLVNSVFSATFIGHIDMDLTYQTVELECMMMRNGIAAVLYFYLFLVDFQKSIQPILSFIITTGTNNNNKTNEEVLAEIDKLNDTRSKIEILKFLFGNLDRDIEHNTLNEELQRRLTIVFGMFTQELAVVYKNFEHNHLAMTDKMTAMLLAYTIPIRLFDTPSTMLQGWRLENYYPGTKPEPEPVVVVTPLVIKQEPPSSNSATTTAIAVATATPDVKTKVKVKVKKEEAAAADESEARRATRAEYLKIPTNRKAIEVRVVLDMIHQLIELGITRGKIVFDQHRSSFVSPATSVVVSKWALSALQEAQQIDKVWDDSMMDHMIELVSIMTVITPLSRQRIAHAISKPNDSICDPVRFVAILYHIQSHGPETKRRMAYTKRRKLDGLVNIREMMERNADSSSWVDTWAKMKAVFGGSGPLEHVIPQLEARWNIT